MPTAKGGRPVLLPRAYGSSTWAMAFTIRVRASISPSVRTIRPFHTWFLPAKRAVSRTVGPSPVVVLSR